MKRIKSFLALVGVLLPFVLVVMLWQIFTAEDLSGLKLAAASSEAATDRDLLAEVTAARATGRAFVCDEATINAHIGRVLSAREADGFEVFAEFERLWVRLEEGGFAITIERDVLGLDSTVTARVKVIRADGGHLMQVIGGRFGQLPVPAGPVNLLRGGLANLSAVFEPEKGVLSEAGTVTLSPGWLRIDWPKP